MCKSGLQTSVTSSLVAAILFICCPPAKANVKLPQIISSNMVIQCDFPVHVWGWADPCEDVTVKFDKNEATTKADSQGKWIVKLPAMKAGGPFQMTVKGKNTIELTNVLVGEVWLCSGQSNMAWNLKDLSYSDADSAAANYPNIRYFSVANKTSDKPLDDVSGNWRVCDPYSCLFFSATAFYYGRELHNELNVPVGLINSSFGATDAEPWIPLEAMTGVDALQDAAKKVLGADAEYKKALAASLGPVEKWTQDARKALDSNSPVPLPPQIPGHPLDKMAPPLAPTSLYNGMIHPLVQLPIRGTIWFQGESSLIDHNDTAIYTEKMKALIGGWRKAWGHGDFPFYFVQISPYYYTKFWIHKSPLFLPELWQAQAATLSAVPNTGMAVTTDISDFKDLHSSDKRQVGKRLALWALAKTYGKTGMVYSGPIYKSMSAEGNKIRVNFDYTGSGLASRDGKPLNWFEIAGSDKKFVKAEAKIEGNTVLVWSDSIAKPVAVRFAWLETAQPNLMNKEGLPASAFITDKDLSK